MTINYGGTAPALTALMAGDIDLFMDGATTTLAQANSPRLRILAITGDKRSAKAPDLPTFKEQGYPSMVIPSWTTVFAPSGTPAPVLQKLRTVCGEILARPDVKSQLTALV